MNKVLNEKLQWKTEFLRKFNLCHKWFALAILVWSQQLIYTGMRDFMIISNYTDSYMHWFYLHIGLLGLSTLVCESVWRQWRIRNGPLVAKGKKLKIMSAK